MSDEDADHGIYFKCLRGANAHLALTEPNSLSIQDAAGRDWICYPVPPHVVQNLDMLSDIVDIDRVDKKARDETDVRLVFCRETSELAEKLVESPDDE